MKTSSTKDLSKRCYFHRRKKLEQSVGFQDEKSLLTTRHPSSEQSSSCLDQSKNKNDLGILIVSQHFPPEIGGGATHVFDMAKYLSELGCFIYVLTVHPWYPYGTFSKGSKLYKSEHFNGIKVFRIWTFQPSSNDPCVSGRFLEYSIFPLHAMSSMFLMLNKLDFDVVITSQPPEPVCIVGYLAKKFFGKKWIMDVRDLWHEAAIDRGYISRDSLISRVSFFSKNKLYAHTDCIAYTSEFIKDHIAKKYGIDERNFFYNPNGIDPRIFKSQNIEKKDQIIYLGSLGHQYDLIPLVDSLDLLDRKIKLIIRGDGENKAQLIEKIEDESRRDQIIFLPILDHNELVKTLSESLLGVISLRDGGTYDFVLPIKVLEYFASGLAVVGSGGKEVKRLLDEERGIFIKNDKKEFADAINLLIRNEDLRKKMGMNGKKFVEENFNKTKIIDALYHRIKEII